MILGNILGTGQISKQLDEINKRLAGEVIDQKKGNVITNYFKGIFEGQKKLNKVMGQGFDSSKIDDYLNSLNGLNDLQKTAVINSSNLTQAQKTEMLERIKNTAVTKANTQANYENVVSDKADTAANIDNIASTTADTGSTAANTMAIRENTKENLKNAASDTASSMKSGKKGIVSGVVSGVAAIARSHPVIAIIAAVVAAAVAGFTIYKKKQKEQAEEIKEAYEAALDSIEETRTKIKNLSNEVDDVKERYAELSQGVDQLTGKNLSLSTDDYEEFLSISNQLAELFPTLTKNYDENGNAILDLSGDIDTVVGSLDQLIEKEKQLALQEIANKMPDVYAGYRQNVENLKTQVDEAFDAIDKINGSYKYFENGVYAAFGINGYATDENGNYTGQNLGTTKAAAEALGLQVIQETITDSYGQAVGYLLKLADGRVLSQQIIEEAYDAAKGTAMNNLRFASSQLENEKKAINQYLSAWLQTDFSYLQIEDTGMQTAVQEMILNFDFDDLPDTIDKNNWEQVSAYLQQNIIWAINNVSDKDVSNALSQVFSNAELTPEAKIDYIKQIQEYFGADHPITLYFNTRLSEVQGENDLYQAEIKKYGEASQDVLKEFFEEKSINTWDELVYWGEVTQGAKDATEAIKMYNEAIISKHPDLSNLEVLSGIQSLSKGLDMLSDIYTDVKDGGEFDWSSILNNDEFKETFDDYDEEYKNFIETVANSPDDIDACQSAFNDLVTAYIFGSDELNHVTEETRNATIAFLEQKGVANATQIVDEKLSGALLNLADAERVAADNGIRLENVTAKEIENLISLGSITAKTGQYLAHYAIQKKMSNKNAITTADDCQELIDLAYAAGYSATYIAKVNELMEKLAKNPSGYKTSGFQLEMERILSETKKEAEKVKIDLFTVGFDGGEAAENAKETFDWIETKISRLQRAIANFGKTVSATWKSWSTRNNALGDEIAGLKNEINIQDDAAKYYYAEAAKVNLSETYKTLVREGAIDIDEISDETIKEGIQKYQELYEKALSAEDAKIDAEDSLAGKLQEQFDLIISKYDGLISKVEHRVNMLNAAMEGAELRGQLVGRSYYEEMAKHEEENIAFLKQKQKELEDAFNNPSDYNITEGSEEWYNLQGQIWEVEEAIAEANNTLQEYNNSMLEADWNIFEKQQEYISQLHSETEFLLDLLDNDDLFDKDTAQMTDNGRAAFGLHVVDYHTYLEEAEDYAEQIAKIEEEIANSEDSTTLLEKKQEYIEAQREAILNAQAEKEAIRDLYEEYYNNLLDVLQEVIDKRKEELQATKD